MKRMKVTRIQLLMLFFVVLMVFASCKSESDSNKMSGDKQGPDMMMSGSMSQSMNAAMKTMMDKMRDYSLTGDADYDFAVLMIPHHQGAIDMSQAYLINGKNQSLKDLAQKNIDNQQQEINDIREWMTRQNETRPSTIDPKYKSSMDNVMKDLSNNMSVQNSDNPDLVFINAMIPHHQAAIDMAKIELQYGKTTRVTELANNIINEQQEDIKNLQNIKTDLMNK